MPTYDVECSGCGYEAIVAVKLADLSRWDSETPCPSCKRLDQSFRRVIKSVPICLSGVKAAKGALSSADKDTMRHAHTKRENQEAKAAAVESARRGE